MCAQQWRQYARAACDLLTNSQEHSHPGHVTSHVTLPTLLRRTIQNLSFIARPSPEHLVRALRLKPPPWCSVRMRNPVLGEQSSTTRYLGCPAFWVRGVLVLKCAECPCLHARQVYGRWMASMAESITNGGKDHFLETLNQGYLILWF